jgi:hypothetical protein
VQEVEVRVKGQIDPKWSKRLGSLLVTHTAAGETVLSGQVRDQSALYGLLERLSGLGLQLMSVTVKVGTAGEATRDVKRA